MSKKSTRQRTTHEVAAPSLDVRAQLDKLDEALATSLQDRSQREAPPPVHSVRDLRYAG